MGYSMEGIARTTAMITDPTAVVERLLVHEIPRATARKILGWDPHNYAGVSIFTIDMELGVPI